MFFVSSNTTPSPQGPPLALPHSDVLQLLHSSPMPPISPIPSPQRCYAVSSPDAYTQPPQYYFSELTPPQPLTFHSPSAFGCPSDNATAFTTFATPIPLASTPPLAVPQPSMPPQHSINLVEILPYSNLSTGAAVMPHAPPSVSLTTIDPHASSLWNYSQCCSQSSLTSGSAPSMPHWPTEPPAPPSSLPTPHQASARRKSLTFADCRQQKSLKPVHVPPPAEGDHCGGPRQLIVNYLPLEVDADGLRSLFEPFGQVDITRIATDPKTSASIGYGFVYMMDHEGAQRAIEQANGRIMHGKRVRVSYANPQRPVATRASS